MVGSPGDRTQIQDRLDLSQQVIGRNVPLKLERVEQLFRMLLSSHHRAIPRIDRCATIESRGQGTFKGSFSTVSLETVWKRSSVANPPSSHEQ
jgi:hypothetical protein